MFFKGAVTLVLIYKDIFRIGYTYSIKYGNVSFYFVLPYAHEICDRKMEFHGD